MFIFYFNYIVIFFNIQYLIDFCHFLVYKKTFFFHILFIEENIYIFHLYLIFFFLISFIFKTISIVEFKKTSLLLFLLFFIDSLYYFINFNFINFEFQYIKEIFIFVNDLNIDILSLIFILITTFLLPLCLLSSWSYIR